VPGELVWVSLYTGLGYYFTGNLEAASAMAVDILGMLAAGRWRWARMVAGVSSQE
jgi:membrane protein DedA with SNARE-associated domain